MFKLGKYQFENFKYRPGHRANYGILTKPGNNEWGMKYSPTYSYDREYEVLNNFLIRRFRSDMNQVPAEVNCIKTIN